MSQQCQHCQIALKGRSDKRFCSSKCKSAFHQKLKKETDDVTKEVDKYLHRNRSILSEIMGKSKKEVVDRLVLVRKGFKFDYLTGIYTNKENKMYRYVYDYGWMDFSDQKVLIILKSKS